MIITRHLIDRTAFKRNLNIPNDLREWLIRQYEWEPYEGFWDKSTLEELITLHCYAYWNGCIDTTPLSPEVLWKKRFESLLDFITEIMLEYHEISSSYNKALEILEKLNTKLQYIVITPRLWHLCHSLLIFSNVNLLI